jgi:hypothetical protein
LSYSSEIQISITIERRSAHDNSDIHSVQMLRYKVRKEHIWTKEVKFTRLLVHLLIWLKKFLSFMQLWCQIFCLPHTRPLRFSSCQLDVCITLRTCGEEPDKINTWK